MLNKNGNTENLKLYHSNGEVSYEFETNSYGYSDERTYDKFGKVLTFKNSHGVEKGFKTTVEKTKETKTKIMLNKNGNTENLKEYHENGKLSYEFFKNSNNYSFEYTHDENGNQLTFKDSEGYSSEFTYDENGNELTFKNSKGVKRGFETSVEETKTKTMLNKNGNTENLEEYHSNDIVSYEFYKYSSGYSYECTYDETGYELTFKNSNGVERGFETTVEEIKETKESGVPAHYDNDNGSLYFISEQRGWSSYLFDIVKRLERSGKKGEFESDLNKSKVVIDIWLKESKLKEKTFKFTHVAKRIK